MFTRIREVRRSCSMTLEEVARACDPPTTAQTIGRLETGMRTVSVGWLNRIAAALGVEASDLVGANSTPTDLKVAAIISPTGAIAPRTARIVIAPKPAGNVIAVVVSGGVSDYRSGDELWCETLTPNDFGRALNRDVLVPRPAGRFLFGRLIDRDADRLQLLPLGAGTRQQVVSNPPWIAMAARLVRSL